MSPMSQNSTETFKTLDFENALKELESIIAKMASGQLSLEDSLKNFEDGIRLARQCQSALKDAEHKVQILVEKNSEYQTQPFSELGDV